MTLLSRSGRTPSSLSATAIATATADSQPDASQTTAPGHLWQLLANSHLEVTAVAADASFAADGRLVVEAQGQGLGAPITAVFHAAGVLEDAMLPKQTLSKLRR